MIQDFAAPPGTPQHLPQQAELIQRAKRHILSALRAHGYQRVQVPLYEPFSLYKNLYGEDIRQHLITFNTDQEYALRPDLTAGIARLYASHLTSPPTSPIRAAAAGAAFRHERVRPLRLREFQQIGLERFGDSPTTQHGADLEILSLARLATDELGLAGNLLTIGHAALREELLEALDLTPNDRKKTALLLDALSRLHERLNPPRTTTDLIFNPETEQKTRQNPKKHEDLQTFLNEITRKIKRPLKLPTLTSKNPTQQADDLTQTLEAHLKTLTQSWNPTQQDALLRLTWSSASLDELADTAAPLWPDAHKACQRALAHIEDCHEELEPSVLRFSLGAARWGGFYTGFYFEINTPVLGPDVSQILGGGRYDTIMGKLGAPDMGACGFAMGLERALEASRLVHGTSSLYNRLLPPSPVLICYTDHPEAPHKAANLAEELGARGCPIAYHPIPITEQHPQGGFTDAFIENLRTIPGSPYRHAILMDEGPWVAQLDNGSCFEANLQTLWMMFTRKK